MFVATVIVSVLLALVLALSSTGKLRRDPRQLETMHRVGVPDDRLWLLASAELAGAAGLVVGLFWWPLGVAAAIGIVLYFVGAVGSHARVRDWSHIAPAAVLLVVAAAALVLRLVSAD